MNEPVSSHDPLEGVAADGTIVTGAHSSRIVQEFKPVLDSAINALAPFVETCSLYVYGSVATGMARLGHSDVDLVAIGLEEAVAQALSKELSAEFGDLCRGVEIGVGHLNNFLGSDHESYGNRVFQRHYCVHLTGPDVSSDLPDFPADSAAACGFNGDIAQVARRWEAELSRGSEVAPLARRIGRKTLFAVSGLISLHDSIWTTDRAMAARRWGEVVPDIASELDTLLAWSNSASLEVSREGVQQAIEGVVARVVDDFSLRIGLWGD